MTLSVSRLYIIDDRTVNEYGAVDGMTAGRRKLSIKRKCAPSPSAALVIKNLTRHEM
jgi:hypothetical protein